MRSMKDILEEMSEWYPSAKKGGPYREHVPAPEQKTSKANQFKYCFAECCKGERDTIVECDRKFEARIILSWWKTILNWVRG